MANSSASSDKAIVYAERDWPVLPLIPGGKEPHPNLGRNAEGKGGLYSATTDCAQIIDWWTKSPDANVGIACGAHNGHVGPFVLDIDNKHGKDGSGDLKRLELKYGELPDTPIVHTAHGGEHRLFADDERTRGKVNGKLYGCDSLDLQGTGNYIVAPPSVVNGKAYEEDTLYNFNDFALPKLPQWLIDGMPNKAPDVSSVPSSGKLLDVRSLTIPKDRKMLLVGGDALDQYHSDTSNMLFALECDLIRAGYGDDDLVTLLMNPMHKGGAKAQGQGEKWLRDDIARARAATMALAKKGYGTPVLNTNSTYNQDESSRNHSIGGNGTELQEKNKKIAKEKLGVPLSDTYNALEMLHDYAQDVRYVHPFWDMWLAWDGRKWEMYGEKRVTSMAKQTIRKLRAHLAEMSAKIGEETYEEEQLRKAFEAHVRRSFNTGKLNAMVDNATSELEILIKHEVLDQQHWKLNCLNGTIDLKTGKLHSHARKDYITKLIKVQYDPEKTCPTWLAFLWRIMGGTTTSDDPDMTKADLTQREAADKRAQTLVSFLKRLLGYCLTGDVSEQIFPILYGEGSNGKSTLIGTMLDLLGPYGIEAAADMLMSKDRENHPTDKTDLFGTRFAATIETKQSRHLDESFLKQATGGDRIRARRMREDFWEFKPTHKLLLATNYKPIIRGTDHAIWRRILLIPFTVIIPDDEQDKSLPDTLKAELPGILAWCVRGCLEWQAYGLCPPDAIKVATQEYRSNQDVMKVFIETMCSVTLDARVRAGELYDLYVAWSVRQRQDTMTLMEFSSQITDRGFKKHRSNGVWYLGIGIPLNLREEKDWSNDS